MVNPASDQAGNIELVEFEHKTFDPDLVECLGNVKKCRDGFEVFSLILQDLVNESNDRV